MLKKKYEKKFMDLIEEYRGKESYDCLVAFSGGKDSTYTLSLLKRKCGLNILAFTFNNWFQSEQAFENMKSVLAYLNVDHLTVTPSFEAFKAIISASLSGDLYSMKTLERATCICTSCISLVRFMSFKIAIEKEIPFVVLGMSPGQAPIATSVFKTNSQMVKKMQDAIYQPLLHHVGNMIKPYFLEERHFAKEDSFPYSINPLAFFDYDEETVLAAAKSIGWVKPQDTDANSTNCLLNSFAIQHHITKYGFHPYAFEIAELVRIGSLTREEGIEKLNHSGTPDVIKQIKSRLQL